MLKKVILAGSLVLATIFANAQVGIGTTDPKSSLEVQGSMGYKVTTITSATTLTEDHHVVLCNNGPYTVTLPPAAANTGRVYRIKNIDAQSDVITIDGNGSETIDGALTYALQPYKHSITLISEGANWYIIENLTEASVVVGSISTISCGSATNNGTLVNSVVASGVSSEIAYTGGNAGIHSGQTVTSTGVTGLTATLVADNFAPGNGSLTYDITGTPASSGTASFAIDIGGQTCTLTRTVDNGEIATINCAGATANGTLVNGVVSSGVSSVIAYTGGNAGPHNGQTVTSTGVTGLTATLVAGTFASGSGSLTYTITGTPTSSGTASFAINIGGQTCTLTRTVNAGSIATITCGSATNNGTLVHGVAASSVSSVIPYTGGNGGTHAGQTVTSTGVTGLTATLTAGNFASGSGNLTYTITGTPASSGTASFAINMGGQTCTLTRTVNAGLITSVDCAGATVNGTLTSGSAASGVSSVIPYTGGNGGTHTGQTVTSTGVTGLTATLTGGNFASGSGSLTYTITGTPATSGTASFAINIGGQTCTLNRTVFAVGTITGLTCGSATNNGTLNAGTAATGVTSVIPYTGGNGGSHNGQTVASTGVTGLTATLSAGVFASGSGNLTYTITGTPGYSGTASFALNIGGRTCTLTRTVNCMTAATAIVDVTNPLTGRTWMDRNLGATQVAASSSDQASFGDYYQWGRVEDGHECKNSATTNIQSPTDIPSHGDFIACCHDWANPSNPSLTFNPCPTGYSVPTTAEWNEEIDSWDGTMGNGYTNNNAQFDAMNNTVLRLPTNGFRNWNNGAMTLSEGWYWRSTSAQATRLQTTSASAYGTVRGNGMGVRCIRNL